MATAVDSAAFVTAEAAVVIGASGRLLLLPLPHPTRHVQRAVLSRIPAAAGSILCFMDCPSILSLYLL